MGELACGRDGTVWVVRRARAEDLVAMVALLADDPLGAGREVGGAGEDVAPAYRAAYAAIESDPNQMLVALEVDGRVRGMCQVTFIPGLSRCGMWRGQIESVRVASELRGRGLGRAMMGAVVEECRRRGCGLVQLTTDVSRPEARRFYEKLGFAASHTGMKLPLR